MQHRKNTITLVAISLVVVWESSVYTGRIMGTQTELWTAAIKKGFSRWSWACMYASSHQYQPGQWFYWPSNFTSNWSSSSKKNTSKKALESTFSFRFCSEQLGTLHSGFRKEGRNRSNRQRRALLKAANRSWREREAIIAPFCIYEVISQFTEGSWLLVVVSFQCARNEFAMPRKIGWFLGITDVEVFWNLLRKSLTSSWTQIHKLKGL